MQVAGTKKAFIKAVSEPGFAKRTGYNKSLVSLWSAGLRVPTLDKMEEVLVKSGANVVQEKVWDLNIHRGI